MVMSMDGPMDLAQGKMTPYLHFRLGDILWFLGWVPQSAGAMIGACIGLFLLALLERWLAASKGLMELHWNTRAELMLVEKLNASPTLEPRVFGYRLMAPPIFLPYDIPRGVVYASHACLNYLIMLAIMTFQLGFILALIAGSGVGETLFGRFSPFAHLH